MQRHLVAALLLAVCITGARAQGNPVDVVDFYNATLDHYFISSLQADIAALDSGALKGWSRTGLAFKAYDGPAPGTSPVCRFYIPPVQGDSHFYSASPAECAEVRQKFPTFSYEAPSVMYVGLPDATSGACGAGMIPVYRLWNKRADTNHRYTTDTAVRASMIAKGYVPEGYGPDGVAMCAANSAERFSLSIAPASVLLLPGETRDVSVTITPRGGFAGTVVLSAAGLPAGVTHQFATSSLTVGPTAMSTTVTIASSSSAPVTANLVQVQTTASESAGFSVTQALGVGVVAPGDVDAIRLRAIAAVEARAQELRKQGLARLALAQAVAAYMGTRAEYVASGVDEETTTAWAWFNDGTVHAFVANRDPAPGLAAAQRVLPQPRDGAELPARMRAMLLHPFGRNFQNQTAINDMQRYFTAKGWIVEALAEGNANVETLKRVSGEGFFYINSHSFRVGVNDTSEPDGKIFAVQSSTVADLSLDRAYLAERTTLQLVYSTAENGNEVTGPDGGVTRVMDTRYGFTYRFVERFMSFPPGSVVFVNGCHSSRNDRFVSAFHHKGAGLYLGWTENVSGVVADSVPQYFVDRMLGTNMHADKESPPQRAFPAHLVLADMAKKGLDVDSASNGKLTAYVNPALAHPPIFAPSIRMAAIDEIHGLLTLYGYFGADKDTVTVDGQKLDVISWVSDEIVATLPLAGAGASGDVVVEVRGVKSNARQVTQWSVGVDFTQKITLPGFSGSLLYEGHGTMRFRGDIGGWRTEPGGPVKFVQRGGFATKDSKIAVTASGTQGVPQCTQTASGSWDYASIASTNGLATGVAVTRALLGVQADTKAGAYGFSLEGEVLPHVVTNCDGKKTNTIASMGSLKGQLLLPDSQVDEPNLSGVPGFQFSLNAAYGMPAQTSTGITNPFIGNVSVTTKAAAATSPPRDSDDSGK